MELNWSLMLHNLYHLAIAYALALPIALNRESSVKSAGLRTFPLVAVAWGKYEIALVLSLLNFVTLSIGKRFKKSLKSSQSNSKTEE